MQLVRRARPDFRQALLVLLALAAVLLAGCVAGGEGPAPYGEPAYGGGPGCPPGHHWDHNYHSCVRDYPGCPPGHRWDGERCVHERPECPPGHHWDGYRCVDNRPAGCPPGHHWDGARCVDNASPGCPPGHYWDNYQRRCLPNPR